ncbi:Arm DNA-binding domain-containing protein [Asticcacaulis sp.]|uniref:Arm DNA-binding domain-containing protein n=1 Tax=Asticcacaulis sp. TaxID=1872648 RepID=UPI003459795C
MSLSDAVIRSAKPKTDAYKLFDTGGLYLVVNPTGSKLWRLKYRYLGKEQLLAVGVYPTVSLKDARRREDATGLRVFGYYSATRV